jgi:hypothetical protein
MIAAALVVLFVLGPGTSIHGDEPLYKAADTPSQSLLATDLLVNGNMEEIPFYWKPPNHFVAGGWLRWWIGGGDIPEYDDVRSWRPYRYDGNHAQVYFRWGQPYTAGIYQRVSGVEPCRFYEFEMYGRNHSHDYTDHHARIGLDPLGRVYNTIDSPEVSSLPGEIVWSPEQTFFYTWGRHTVTAEALGNSITAIAYASPDPGHGYYDTFWDAGSLVESTPPSGRLPEPSTWTPSGFVQNVSATPLLDQVVITWDTAEPASSQVWYNVNITTTNNTYAYASAVDMEPKTHHRVVIDGFQSGTEIQFVAVSRRYTGGDCVTSVSAPQMAYSPLPTDRLPTPRSWTPSGFVTDVITETALDVLFVSWETPERASATQVWYDIVPEVITPVVSVTLPYSNPVYLPLIMSGPDYTFEFATRLDLPPTLHHQSTIRGLNDGDSVYFIAVSSYVVGDRIVTEVSDTYWVRDIEVPEVILDTYVPIVRRE